MNVLKQNGRGALSLRFFGWLTIVTLMVAGCRSHEASKENKEFFTSGSREADQRASQRMAKAEQIADSGKNDAEEETKQAKPGPDGIKPAQVEGRLTLFDRLGGLKGLNAIVEDFTPRVMQDPRVNWNREGVKRGGFFWNREKASAVWAATPENVAQLKKHMVQFLALASGGPPEYEGKDMKASHAGMRITNPEFDAVIGDLKATLDRLQIPDKEQKELLSIVESTRPQIVTER